ncbi:hypothetical protein BGX27_001590 [Mortierella sp. AM989]|nr:hypothetical protein BGX27_001590 [Mortierella sp. AM989]
MHVPIRGVLIDVSGTVHVGENAIPGAAYALDRLRASGIPFRFCTNTTQSSGDTLATKLKKLGLNVNRNEIFTPLLILEKDALQEFEGIPQSEPFNAVVVGLSPTNFNYTMKITSPSSLQLNKAFRLLVGTEAKSQPATLIAVHKAKYFADGHDGKLSMGPGGFVEALEYSSGVKAHVVGKPEKAFFELAIQNMGLESPAASDPSQQTKPSKGSSGIVMIGDDVEQDLGGGAAELGLIRYLVKTGKYRSNDEGRDAFGGLDGTFSDFAAAVDHILAGQQKQ